VVVVAGVPIVIWSRYVKTEMPKGNVVAMGTCGGNGYIRRDLHESTTQLEEPRGRRDVTTRLRKGGSAEDQDPRIGLVLGAGGVVGGAFHAGVLAALAEATGWDPRTASVIVGTSAGSVTAAALRSGLSACDLRARAENRPLSPDGAALLRQVTGGSRPQALQPERRQWRSPAELSAMIQQTVRRPLASRPLAILASLVPDGRVDTAFISSNLSGLVGNSWPAEKMWICSVRQRDGRRVVFGREGTAPVPLAVAASSAIPGMFRPVVIDGVSYIDGGAHSPTNADVVLNEKFDLVLVSSPMSIASRSVRLSADQLPRRWARMLLESEAVRIRRRGTPVLAFQPTPDDLAVMGLRAMAWARRPNVARQAHSSTLRRLARRDMQERLAPLIG
jgi:NTE family protein